VPRRKLYQKVLGAGKRPKPGGVASAGGGLQSPAGRPCCALPSRLIGPGGGDGGPNDSGVSLPNLAEGLTGSWGNSNAPQSGCCRARRCSCGPTIPKAPLHPGAFSPKGGRPAWTEALAPLERAIELQPGLATAHNNLGIVLQPELGRRDEALVQFPAVRWRSSRPLRPGRGSNLGQMLLDGGSGGGSARATSNCREAGPPGAPNLAPGPSQQWANVLPHPSIGSSRRSRRLSGRRCGFQPEAGRLGAGSHLGLVLQKEAKLVDALVWLKQATTRSSRPNATLLGIPLA